MIGFESFLLMNDNSTDDTQCILDAYAQEGIVIPLPPDLHDKYKLMEDNQNVYDVCTDYLKNRRSHLYVNNTWIMTHDVDEFVWINKTMDGMDTVQAAMANLIQRYGTFVQSMEVPRFFFGSSNHEKYESHLVLERFNHRFNLGSCPQRKRRRALGSKRIARRRRLVGEAAPMAYCKNSHRNDSYRNVKSVSAVRFLAETCFKRDKQSRRIVPDKCSSTHRHTLAGVNEVTTEATYSILSRDDDLRYLAQEKVGPMIAIVHYAIKSRQEFYERICESVWKDKYFQCPGCNPETYFNDTETCANNYLDDRMVLFVAQLKPLLYKSNDISRHCNTSPSLHSLEYYRKCIQNGTPSLNKI